MTKEQVEEPVTVRLGSNVQSRRRKVDEIY